MTLINVPRPHLLYIKCAAAVVAAAVLWATTGNETVAPTPPPASPPDPWLLPPEDSQVPGRAIAAAEAHGLRDADLVIGVTVAGHHRAYPVRGFWSGSHSVNDLVRGVPITVTYCGLNRCAAVFTGDGDKPLGVYSAGYMTVLLLKFGGQVYRQDTLEPFGRGNADPFPFRAFAYELMPWREWREAHPDTDVSAP
jgi:Protein of unknown function (DUF3179)